MFTYTKRWWLLKLGCLRWLGTEQVKALRRKKLQGEDCDPSYICSSRLSPSPSLVTVVSPSYICSLYNNCCLFSSKAIIVTKLSSLHLIEPIDMKKLSHFVSKNNNRFSHSAKKATRLRLRIAWEEDELLRDISSSSTSPGPRTYELWNKASQVFFFENPFFRFFFWFYS